MRNALCRPGAPLPPGERLLLALGDGDALSARLDRPPVPAGRPAVVLIHGLGGDEASRYVAASARHLTGLGHPVVRLNLRGAGPSRATARGHYHAGLTRDLAAALAALPGPLLGDGLDLVGYSLGGNLLLKFLGEGGHGIAVRAAAAVSVPLDLAAAARRLLAPRNAIYQRYILHGLRREALGSDLGPAERAAVTRARTVIQFDDGFVAPRHGFRDAWDYYAQSSSGAFLGGIAAPTLMIHALDDPWIPPESYRAVPWDRLPRLTPLLTTGGGHVGFHAAGSPVPWHDRMIGAFFGRG